MGEGGGGAGGGLCGGGGGEGEGADWWPGMACGPGLRVVFRF